MAAQRIWFLALAALLPHAPLPAQSTRPSDLAAGRFLVASRGLLDPNFAHTVVLLVRYEPDEVLGLIVNRRSSVPIARAFPDTPDRARGRTDPIYNGGPVERAVALALLRSRAAPRGSLHLFADVSMLTAKSLLEKAIAEGAAPGTFHLYSGYSGWTRDQLRREVELGGWFIFEGDAALVFDPDPESLWLRLIRKTEQRMALAGATEPVRCALLLVPQRLRRIQSPGAARRPKSGQ
ncbi:MAG TPA: YqgE/AlgH family protein [Bryobacteraceae bacterium]|nr:YqgE/AlgH family protein [Bryobacteraceae bacterium]